MHLFFVTRQQLLILSLTRPVGALDAPRGPFRFTVRRLGPSQATVGHTTLPFSDLFRVAQAY